jgi:hypothetical protein
MTKNLKDIILKKYPHLISKVEVKEVKDISQNKAIPEKCVGCNFFERGPDLPKVGVIDWCVSSFWDRGAKRTVTVYRNIESMDLAYCQRQSKED